MDSRAEELVRLLDGAGGERLADLTPAEARRRQAALRAQAGAGPAVDRVEQLRLPASDRELPARAYAGRSGAALPVLLYLHGGGFVTGGLDPHDYRARSLARAAGCLLVSIDYRLAPEHRFPAAAEDAYVALEWLAASADQIGGDRGLVAIAGDSSGGNLAAAATLMARDRGGPRATLQVLTCPLVDARLDSASMIEFADGYVLGRDDVRWCWDHYLADPADADHPYASPLRAEALADLPPALVVTAELDPLRDQGEAYARRLHEAGVAVSRRRYPGLFHSFVDLEEALPAARNAVAEVAAALRTAWSERAGERSEG